MNKIYLFTFLLLAVCTETRSQEVVSVISKNKDTLYLINDETGKLIAQTWDKSLLAAVPSGSEKKPVIVFKSEADLRRMKKNPIYNIVKG